MTREPRAEACGTSGTEEDVIAPELWQRLRAFDTDDVVTRSLASITEDGCYRLPMLGSHVVVDAAAEAVSPAWPDVIRPDYFLWVSVVQYLLSVRDIPLAGELVPVTKLPYGEVFFRGPHALPGDALGAIFGSDGDWFREVMFRLGAENADLGEVGARVSVFPRLPIWLGFWAADDEFPARVTFLFDYSAGDHLPVDALWSAVMVLAGAVRRLAASH